jgi:hypothetical protein
MPQNREDQLIKHFEWTKEDIKQLKKHCSNHKEIN